MPKLYALAYKCHSLSKRRAPPNPNGIAAAFWSEVREESFPYDTGDDPAFFSARHLNGPVTWGVCRPNVRGKIAPGDWAVFIAAVEQDGSEGEIWDYQLVAALRVRVTIRHADIFRLEANRKYRQYLNLLMRPSKDGWEHHEPAVHKSQWHKDWLWRVASNRRYWEKKELSEEDHPIAQETVAKALQTAPGNYVIFDSTSAILPPVPLHVARWCSGDKHEIWYVCDRVQRIRNLIFGDEPQPLRIQSRMPRHPHRMRELRDPRWHERFSAAIQG